MLIKDQALSQASGENLCEDVLGQGKKNSLKFSLSTTARQTKRTKIPKAGVSKQIYNDEIKST